MRKPPGLARGWVIQRLLIALDSSVGDSSSAFMRRLVISRIAAARTRMEPPMYRMVVPMPPVEGPKGFPFGEAGICVAND